jgi:hypothetical protein
MSEEEQVQIFNAAICKMLMYARAIQLTPSERIDVDRSIALINECFRYDAAFIIARAAPKMWHFREQIHSRDEKYFLADQKEYKKFIVANSSYSRIQEAIIDICRRAYKQLKKKDIDALWHLTDEMYASCMKYHLLKGTHPGES